jgi:hypothetical protein
VEVFAAAKRGGAMDAAVAAEHEAAVEAAEHGAAREVAVVGRLPPTIKSNHDAEEYWTSSSSCFCSLRYFLISSREPGVTGVISTCIYTNSFVDDRFLVLQLELHIFKSKT